MRAKILLGASGLALALTASALAGQSAEMTTPPTFSPEEVRIIHRNAALASVIDSDPWAVRRALDVLAAARSDNGTSATAGNMNNSESADAQPTSPAGIDLQKNPDLRNLDRSSPEAAFDLFRLLKQAGSKRPGVQAR